ncbi:hypothetical protein JRI60_50370 [Archangium violaceum]|nr:hypothetical protein [Archangium violaceum]QRN97076.1 hypothetical protein JRI60_50370 [Archangium violaceum]
MSLGGVALTCSVAGPEGTCGCGPQRHALRHADFQKYTGWEDFDGVVKG